MKLATIVAAAARAQIVVDFDSKGEIYSEGECDATTTRPPFADNDVFQTRWFRTPESSVAGTVSRVVFIQRFQERLCGMVRNKYSSLGSRQLRRALRNDDFAESAFSPVDDQDLVDEFDLIVNSRSVGMPLNFKRVDVKCIGDLSDGVCDKHAFRLCCPSIADEKSREVTQELTTTKSTTTTTMTTTLPTLDYSKFVINDGSIDISTHNFIDAPIIYPSCEGAYKGTGMPEDWQPFETMWAGEASMSSIGNLMTTANREAVCDMIRNNGSPNFIDGESRITLSDFFGVKCIGANADGSCRTFHYKYCCEAIATTTTSTKTTSTTTSSTTTSSTTTSSTTTTPTTTSSTTTTSTTTFTTGTSTTSTTTTTLGTGFIMNNGAIDFASHDFLNTPLIDVDCESSFEGSGDIEGYHSFESSWMDVGKSWIHLLNVNGMNTMCNNVRDNIGIAGTSFARTSTRSFLPSFVGISCYKATAEGSCDSASVKFCCPALFSTTTTEAPVTGTSTEEPGSGDGSGDEKISIEEVKVLISSWVESSIAASKSLFPGYRKLGKANRHINKMNKIIKKLIKKDLPIECGSEPGIENSRKFRKSNEETITETFISPFLDILRDHKDCESYSAFEPRLQKMNNALVNIFRKLN